MESLECQVQEHDTGDFWAIGRVETDIPPKEVTIAGDNLGSEWYRFDIDGQMRKFGTFELEKGKRWKNRRCIKSKEAEKPKGEWNTVELIFFEGTIIHSVNGQVVNRLYNIRRVYEDGVKQPLLKGKIALQSEGAEIFFKDISTRSIKSAYPTTILPGSTF